MKLYEYDFRRFIAKVHFTDTHWLWIGSTNEHGYGQMRLGKTTVRAHRVSYELFVAPIKHEISHAEGCPRNCVNPDHLCDRTKVEHVRLDKSLRPGKMCGKGRHMIETWDDLYESEDGHRRWCRHCRLASQARWRRRRGR